jgi:hypothetical protein
VDIVDVLKQLDILESASQLNIEWDKSQATFPHRLSFLEPMYLNRACSLMFRDQAITKRVLQVAKELIEDEFISRMLWHQHYLIVQNHDRFRWKAYSFPVIQKLGENTYPYFLLLALSGFGIWETRQEISPIPIEYFTPGFEELAESIYERERKTGQLGLLNYQAGWAQGMFRRERFRFGRLQFQMEGFASPFRIFEKAEERKIQVIAEDGLHLDTEGLIDGLEGNHDPEGFWSSQLTESLEEVSGNPVENSGFVKHETITLSRVAWTEIVRAGDPVLGIHVPAGQPLQPNACKSSMDSAVVFFRKYFPQFKFRGFTCGGWLLDPRLPKFLPDTSNIVQFQKLFYRIPLPIFHFEVCLQSIFGDHSERLSLDKLPSNSSLQKACLNFLRSGRKLRKGYGFIRVT